MAREHGGERLVLGMKMPDVVVSMVEGNPGALSVAMRLMDDAKAIDPSMLAMLPLALLDALGIYGSRIWILYKDVCGSDIEKMLLVLRAEMLGLACVHDTLIDYWIAHNGKMPDGSDINFERIAIKVRQKLPKFGKIGGYVENTLAEAARSAAAAGKVQQPVYCGKIGAGLKSQGIKPKGDYTFEISLKGLDFKGLKLKGGGQ